MAADQEPPPPFLGDQQKWNEDLTDYLVRKFANINAELDDLEARVEILEGIVVP
jgi:hypothetical protein